ncbi:hypothetical protein [Mycobacterium sp. 141]|uniref:hypothetical protein n=1 Tax=Mycobacterium sp. 141 TaxID=1120797 RepID=UPI000364EBE0
MALSLWKYSMSQMHHTPPPRSFGVRGDGGGLDHGLFDPEAGEGGRNHYQLLERGLSNRKTKRPANPRLSMLVALSEVLGVSVPKLIDAIFADSN